MDYLPLDICKRLLVNYLNLYEVDNIPLDWELKPEDYENFATRKYNGAFQSCNLQAMDRISEGMTTLRAIRNDFNITLIGGGLTVVWSRCKQVFEPDRDFSELLMDSANLKIYPNMIKFIPYQVIYIDFEKNSNFGIDGCFVYPIIKDDEIELKLLISKDNNIYMDLVKINFDKDGFIDEQGNRYYIYDNQEQISNYHNKMLSVSDRFVEDVVKIKQFIWHFLMYISSTKPDIQEDEITKNTYRYSKDVKNKFSEIQKWKVGVRYGDKIRAYKKGVILDNDSISDNSSERTPVRPHVRRAHWHHYWVGSKNNKRMEIRWIMPSYINGGNIEVDTVIHPCITGNEIGSSGESALYNILDSFGIIYQREYTISEIGRRFDICVLVNDKKCFIEFDGEQHFVVVEKWGGVEGLAKRQMADKEKTKYCELNNIPLLRIRFDQKYNMASIINSFLSHPDEYLSIHNPFMDENEYYIV